MGGPDNGVYIVQGEVSLLMTAMRRNSRWTSHSHQDNDQDPLKNCFSQLRDLLNTVSELDELTPNEFLGPFLDVIRSEDTTGPITGLALSSVNKFLSYGLVNPENENAAAAIENIADAVTHARFVGTDPASDEVVLMKILHVLRTLMLTPAGAQLTNESVCEIMQSCFRICFEMRLSELLRKDAEHTLMDMTQLLFSRLPQFKEDSKWAINMKKLKMRAGVMETSRKKQTRSPKPKMKMKAIQNALNNPPPEKGDITSQQDEAEESSGQASRDDMPVTDTVKKEESPAATAKPEQEGPVVVPPSSLPTPPESDPVSPEDASLEVRAPTTISTTPVAVTRTVVDIQNDFQLELDNQIDGDRSSCASDVADVDSVHSVATNPDDHQGTGDIDYINPRGVRFTPHQHDREGSGPLIPYGMPCVRELFRFLISLTNPIDRHNTDVMVHMGLNLLTVALESGADHIASFNSLLTLVKDDMCRNLFFLLQSDRISLFAASIRVCFLLFESMRGHLKLQLEMYLGKLMDIIVSDSPKVSYEQRELSLESVVQLCRIPGLIAEMYVNYDCDLYCSNLFEDLMKLLSKNAFPVSGLFSTHLLSLEALLAVIDGIEQHCHQKVLQAAKAPEADGSAALDGNSDETTVNGSAPCGPSLPPITGFAMATRMGAITEASDTSKTKGKTDKKTRKIRPNRMKVSENIPTDDVLNAVKLKKKLYQTGTELFNSKPAKGIAFLQEQKILSTPLDPEEVVTFIKENPKLDKKQIGEYISNKKNARVLEAYQRSFHFSGHRVDECLRMYLENFRLPGEAPVISYLLEHFADHWHKTNGEPFANVDACFTLAYAIIMLNVDQHNYNAKKQNIPMTVEEFKKNLKKVNGGGDFDQDMLDEIYCAIKNEEIVMPAEQTGLVKENYLWKVLLRRGSTKEGSYVHVPTGGYDRDLFSLVWGPTVAALSFVFDKSMDENIIQKAISGFRKCAMVAAHYSLSDVFDNLVISLCKFTTLLSPMEPAENIPIHFGSNPKAQVAAKTVFGLAHRHGDILREGWKNMLDCILQLYRAKLLPELLVTAEDFIETNGRISLIKEDTSAQQKADTGVLSSFYSYFSLSEPAQQKQPTLEEQEASRKAQSCIEECHLEQLVTDSKFLTDVSLQELIKALIFMSGPPEPHEHMEYQQDDESSVFFLEFLIKVALQNRDRLGPFWAIIRDHFYNLMVYANERSFLVERAVVGLLRLAIRLLRREEIAPQVLESMKLMLMMKPVVVHAVSRQISYGLHELLRTNAANIHLAQDWFVLFSLLEVVGAGTNPPAVMQVASRVTINHTDSDSGAQSDSELPTSQANSEYDRGYGSDGEIYDAQNKHQRATVEISAKIDPNSGSWLLVNKHDKEEKDVKGTDSGKKETSAHGAHFNQFDIALDGELLRHRDTKCLMKSCETLAFLVRDAAHITPHNFESCVHCIRTFVEASVNGGTHLKRARAQQNVRDKRGKHKKVGMKKSRSSPSHLADSADSEEEKEADGFHSLSIQLLDLMHTLHTRAASIFSSWAEEEKKRSPVEPHLERIVSAEAGTLWVKCWCPLLQGIARLCCDTRRQVRSQALTYLQRALLVHDLQTLSAVEWESCFNKVLFPLLSKLLQNINTQDPTGIEETRMRASTLLCKVFLQHLSPLMSLSTFTALWLTILEYMDKYMHADKSDLLNEAVPESLKNMLLVMHTAGILSAEADESQLWKMTWDRIDTFLPSLKEEVFKPHDLVEPKRPVMREPVPEAESQPDKQKDVGGKAGDQSVSDQQAQAKADNPPTENTAVKASQNQQAPPKTQQQERSASPAGSPVRTPPRSESPMDERGQKGVASKYILHPPLPTKSSAATKTTSQPAGTVPLLLNPDIIHGTKIPIISPQKTAETQPDPPPSIPKEAVVVEDI